MATADRYRTFAEVEAAGSSPKYEALALAVSENATVLRLLETLEAAKRQPNLLFAACQYLDLPFDEPEETISLLLSRWSDVSEVMRGHVTQTNEPARAATFLPILATLPQPLALIEVGASAGLCLYPDRFYIRYGDADPVGDVDSPVHLDVAISGPVPIPDKEISVAWRVGIDLNPLDVRRSEDLAWLSACIWPEHEERRTRLYAAARILQKNPPDIRKGDLVEDIDEILQSVPSGVTPVVFHSAVLNYVEASRRIEFARRLRTHKRAMWISNEGPGVVANLEVDAPVPPGSNTRNYFVLGLMGERAVAKSDPHGRWLSWASDMEPK